MNFVSGEERPEAETSLLEGKMYITFLKEELLGPESRREAILQNELEGGGVA